MNRSDTIEVIVEIPDEAVPDTARLPDVEPDLGRRDSSPGVEDDGAVELSADDLVEVEEGGGS